MSLATKYSKLIRRSNIESQYKVCGKVNDDTYGNAILLINPSLNKIIAMKESKVEANEEESALTKFKMLETKLKRGAGYFISMIDFSSRLVTGMNFSYLQLREFYEYEPNNLKLEIMSRISQKRGFSGEEVTHIFYSIIEGGAQLQKLNDYHGDIRPEQIIITREGIPKLGPVRFENKTALEIQINYVNLQRPVYCSPSLFKSIKEGNFYTSRDWSKDDVFSLALCILEIGLMADVRGVYTKSSEINVPELRRLINQFNDRFHDNQVLCSAVTKMLDPSDALRPSFITLISKLPPYDEILDFLSTTSHFAN